MSLLHIYFVFDLFKIYHLSLICKLTFITSGKACKFLWITKIVVKLVQKIIKKFIKKLFFRKFHFCYINGILEIQKNSILSSLNLFPI